MATALASDLTYKHEKTLFKIALVISVVFWLALIVGTFGLLLIYLLFALVFFLFVQSAFISHLRGNGVKITEQQFPDIHARVVAACAKVGQEVVPDTYLLRTDFFNALATRFLGRNFIVLYSDVVDALEEQQDALDFYIGHEVGHIHRNHLRWAGVLFPALLLPLLGTAYRRAQEYTCDHYGSACCATDADVQAAIAAISAGDTRWKTIDVQAYLLQLDDTRGFWMSLNELTSDYPWLTKRLAVTLAKRRGEQFVAPRRSTLAWLLALFIPRFGAGGGAVSLLMTIAVLGILAAIAIPAYDDYVARAQHHLGYQESLQFQSAVGAYAEANGEWPTTMMDLGYEGDVVLVADGAYEVGIYEDGVVATLVGEDTEGEGQYIVLEPVQEEGTIEWICYGQNLEAKLLPPVCR